ncbi:hypothetical protein COCMIDRAFT_107718 [Bipolaris oryzae ATCC 44560]|uniref:Uncharacterized protein n=1 Tax=Bipolaris oryzae ATCC 44560 TaxID=930090 RepID=W6YTI2_COCMI|nr:uncharacterized protein COCMIDRAFT_107718 [Bipolaris oryzae ATCC 44560]EUC40848.1 hypothetical protein COCMIDRAFT_107718 [Bipolaris oryzae ATCC 44560]
MAWWLFSWVSRSVSERKKVENCVTSTWLKKSAVWFDDRSGVKCVSWQWLWVRSRLPSSALGLKLLLMPLPIQVVLVRILLLLPLLMQLLPLL